MGVLGDQVQHPAARAELLAAGAGWVAVAARQMAAGAWRAPITVALFPRREGQSTL